MITGVGAHLHLAHPLGQGSSTAGRRATRSTPRTPRTWRICCGWAGCPRRGSPCRRSGSYGSLVRHRVKLVALRSHCKVEIHAVLAKCGVQVSMSDLFGVAGAKLLERVELPGVYRGRIDSLRRLMASLEFEIDVYAGLARGYTAVQIIPGVGPTPAAVFVAEIGGCALLRRAGQAGLLVRAHPETLRVRHPRAPLGDHQAELAAGALGGGGVSAKALRGPHCRRVPRPDRRQAGPQHRGGDCRPQTVRARLLRPARSPRARPRRPQPEGRAA